MTSRIRFVVFAIEILRSGISFGQAPAKMPDYATYVNNRAVKSGNASDPRVWSRPLADGDWLGVPSGVAINWDLTSCPRLAGIYDAGTINAGRAQGDLVVNAGTIFIDMDGALMAGNCDADTPLAANTLTITFLDLPLDPVEDPGQFSGGLLVMGGTLNMCGSKEKTAWLTTMACRKGDTNITLLDSPADWRAGDRLLIPGCFLSPVQDEVVAIQSIVANVVKLSTPIAYDHIPIPQPQGQPNTLPIGNLTRRITLKSENPAGVRGHCMFMKSRVGLPSMVSAYSIALNDLGRTIATEPVTDPTVDAVGELVPKSDLNPRGRYSWHSHRQGQAADALQDWDTIAISGFRKWAFVNHDSNVDATNLVAYGGQGACFVTERGSEIGTFDSCLGVRTSGGGPVGFMGAMNRHSAEDFGWQGDGIWLQGPGVTLHASVVCGHPDAGVRIFTAGASRFGFTGSTVLAQTFRRALLPSSLKLINPIADPQVVQVPYFGISDNVAFGCGVGHFCDWNQTDVSSAFNPLVRSTLTRPVSWNCPIGVETSHISNFEIDGAVLSGPNCAARSMAFFANPNYDVNFVLTNPQMAGFETGLTMPLGIAVAGGYYSNVWDVFDNMASNHSGIFQMTGNPLFAPVSPSVLAGRQPLNFKMSPYVRSFFDVKNVKNPNDYLYPITYLLPNGLEVYKTEQAPDFVPFQNPAIDPPFLLGLTNAQLSAQYGMAVGDRVAGTPVSPAPYTTNGIIAEAQPVRPFFYFGGGVPGSPVVPTNRAYNLAVYDNYSSHIYYADHSPTTLQLGWNALTRNIRGQTYTFFVNLTGAAPAAMVEATATRQSGLETSDLETIVFERQTALQTAEKTKNAVAQLAQRAAAEATRLENAWRMSRNKVVRVRAAKKRAFLRAAEKAKAVAEERIVAEKAVTEAAANLKRAAQDANAARNRAGPRNVHSGHLPSPITVSLPPGAATLK